MIVDGEEYDHIEIYDETGRFLISIADEQIIKPINMQVKLCKTDRMFTDE